MEKIHEPSKHNENDESKNTFTANHPKFVSFLQYAFGSGIPADSVIEITVTKPGQEPVTSNIMGFTVGSRTFGQLGRILIRYVIPD